MSESMLVSIILTPNNPCGKNSWYALATRLDGLPSTYRHHGKENIYDPDGN